MHTFDSGKRAQQTYKSRRYIANHNSGNQQHKIAAQYGCKGRKHCQHGSRTYKRGNKHEHKARDRQRCRRKAAAKQHDSQRGTEACAGVYAEYGRVGQRIGKTSLEHEARRRKCRTAKHGCHGLNKARLEDNKPPCFVGRTPQKHVAHSGSRNVDRPEENIKTEKHHSCCGATCEY